jgi:hypothetical protein
VGVLGSARAPSRTAGLPSPFKAVRYHSLAGVPSTLPPCLEVSCRTASGVIQGVRHRELNVEGVQVRHCGQLETGACNEAGGTSQVRFGLELREAGIGGGRGGVY